MNKITKLSCMFLLLAVILLASCRISKEAEKSSNETSETASSRKYLADESSLIKTKNESEKSNGCENQIKELEDEIEMKKYLMIRLDTNMTKISISMQYLKEALGKEKEYENALSLIQELSDKRKELSNELALNEDALEILKKKCGPENKLISIKKSGS